ncbi:SCO family protein [Marinobacter fonticola]|uniref:SCO family protein n=1 Tax=Marinobacter fonticola TaxID=2603215 RepID=UPI0011E7A9C7|nr:SCO family protein [Marinobacter fonticola]
MSQRNAYKRIRLTLTALLLLVALVVGIVVSRQVFLVPDAADAPPPPELSAINTYVYDEGRPLVDYTLTNEQGETVTNEALKGRWTFAFIGYTYCPDVCPATLAMLRQTGKAIPADLPEPSYLLISADPERDTPQRMEEYLDFFGEDFHGLTGDLETLRELAKSMNAVFAHREDGQGNTLVDHSAHLALLNPEGEMIAVIQPPLKPDNVAKAFGKIYQWAKAKRDLDAS